MGGGGVIVGVGNGVGPIVAVGTIAVGVAVGSTVGVTTTKVGEGVGTTVGVGITVGVAVGDGRFVGSTVGKGLVGVGAGLGAVAVAVAVAVVRIGVAGLTAGVFGSLVATMTVGFSGVDVVRDTTSIVGEAGATLVGSGSVVWVASSEEEGEQASRNVTMIADMKTIDWRKLRGRVEKVIAGRLDILYRVIRCSVREYSDQGALVSGKVILHFS